jgi:hypothetical protein
MKNLYNLTDFFLNDLEKLFCGPLPHISGNYSKYILYDNYNNFLKTSLNPIPWPFPNKIELILNSIGYRHYCKYSQVINNIP